MATLIHSEISEEILGAAMAVLNELRPGLGEKIYENSLIIELVDRGHKVETQQRFPVHYKEHIVGTLIPDLIIDGLVIVDTKVVTAFCEHDMAKMLGYLSITQLRLGILLNFRYTQLQWKRIVK